MVGVVLSLMYEFRALPVFENGIGGLQKNRQMESLWNDVISSFVGYPTDADLKRRNDVFGVELGKNITHNFFPELPGSAEWTVNKDGVGSWTKGKFKPGMTTNHAYTSQRCMHCELAVTEQIRLADKIEIVDDHHVILKFKKGHDVRVHFEQSVADFAKKSVDQLRFILATMAKKQMRTLPTVKGKTESRYARYRSFNPDCDHYFVTTGHTEHADLQASVNIARNGFQELLTVPEKKAKKDENKSENA